MQDHAVIILRNGKKALFVQRSTTKKFLPNIWAFPSGTVEKEETLEQTAVREAKEELDIAIEIEKTLTIVEFPELNVRLTFMVCTKIVDKPIVCNPTEIQAAQWLTLDNFFRKYNDSQIGHGLQYLRKHPKLLNSYCT